MKNNYQAKVFWALRLFFFLLTLFIGGALILSCGAKKPSPDPQFVAAVSGGVLGKMAPVKVVFTQSQDISKTLDPKVFSFHPAAKGTVSWQDEYTLVFSPTESLKPGQRYQVQVNLSGIPVFSFDFMTALPSLSVNIDPIQIDENGDVLVRGIVHVDEGEEISVIEQTVSSPELGKPSWLHENNVHRFTFNPVQRFETSRTASITWDGKSLGSKEKGFTSVVIPGLEIFEVVSLREDDGVIEVSFSSPLKAYTDLRGFISLSGKTDVRYSLEGNIVRIFGDSSGGIPTGAELTIQDLEDINGRPLAVPIQYVVPDKWELPEIRFAGLGTILPTSQGSQMVVETRNVSGLLVEAFQVYGNNMLQFLQVNNLDGEYELDRVGEPVWTKAFDFPWAVTDQNRWVRRGLDVSELSRKYPGSMFRIRVSFRPRHVHYVCSAGHGDFSSLNFPDDSFPAYYSEKGGTYWDNYWNTPNFNWSEWYNRRNDPCHPAFYVTNYYDHNVTVGRNVLVSDLGLLAK